MASFIVQSVFVVLLTTRLRRKDCKNGDCRPGCFGTPDTSILGSF